MGSDATRRAVDAAIVPLVASLGPWGVEEGHWLPGRGGQPVVWLRVRTEAQARAMYALETSEPVEETGFHPHPLIAMSGASPDGLVGARGLVEIKCPNTATHIATLTGAAIDRKYLLQMQWQMACTGRAWCDFVCFDPRMPEGLQLYIKRVDRDDAYIADLASEIRKFLAEVEAKVSALQRLIK